MWSACGRTSAARTAWAAQRPLRRGWSAQTAGRRSIRCTEELLKFNMGWGRPFVLVRWAGPGHDASGNMRAGSRSTTRPWHASEEPEATAASLRVERAKHRRGRSLPRCAALAAARPPSPRRRRLRHPRPGDLTSSAVLQVVSGRTLMILYQ